MTSKQNSNTSIFHSTIIRSNFFRSSLLSLCLLGFAIPSNASWLRHWDSIPIDGAKCALGDPYKVFISPGRSDKVAFYFMGGGACWSKETCFGVIPHTILFPLPFVYEIDGLISPFIEESPIADYTVVYFPYCTGDVHLGNHTAVYGDGKTVNHHGWRNIEMSLSQLHDQKTIDFAGIKNLVSYGYSAGAIGALVHLKTFDRFVPQDIPKTLIADAPGLHFGLHFWEKFSPELVADFKAGLKDVGADLDASQGNVASLVPGICKTFPKWKMGFLQGSRDIVMSLIFGSISMAEHEKLVYGPTGIYELTKDPNDNCSAWVPRSRIHTFLVTLLTSVEQTESPKTAMEFSRDLIQGNGGLNYK
jgi:hypothetical protein